MGRRRTGSLVQFRDEQHRERYRIGLTPPPPLKGRQIWKTLEPGTTAAKAKTTRDAWLIESAENPRKFFPELFDATAGPGEKVSDWVDRWLTDRSARGLQTRVDLGRLEVHAFPTIGDKAMTAVTREDLEDIVEKLDRKVRAGTIKWRTARNAWGIVSKMFADATNAKTRALRVCPTNPAVDVRGPDRGDRTLKVYMYPSEFLKFVDSDDVPLGWRRLVTLAIYLYVRLGELEALEWEDVDLERGTIHVHRAINREDGEVKATKTGVPRKFRIEPAVLPLLRTLHEESGGKGSVIAFPSETNHARALRTYLTRAGVTRAELHAMGDKTRKAMTAYDLRSTGITWRAVRGDDPLKIMSAAGRLMSVEGG